MLYPDFKPLELNDKPVFDQAFKNYPPIISEFTFTNLYAWRDAYQFSFSYFDGCLVIRAMIKKQPCFFMPVANDKDNERIIRKIAKETHSLFIRITQNLANLFTQDTEFLVAEDVDNSDYLYKTEDLVAMLNEFLSKEAADFRFVNMEQDLGVLGLRKAKMSYHPTDWKIYQFALVFFPRYAAFGG